MLWHFQKASCCALIEHKGFSEKADLEADPLLRRAVRKGAVESHPVLDVDVTRPTDDRHRPREAVAVADLRRELLDS